VDTAKGIEGGAGSVGEAVKLLIEVGTRVSGGEVGGDIERDIEANVGDPLESGGVELSGVRTWFYLLPSNQGRAKGESMRQVTSERRPSGKPCASC
jgi:hypothetical protein